jgi:hypothetical protein
MAQVSVCAAIMVCLLAVPAPAQDCPELVGHLRGPIEAVAVAGSYAYLGRPTGLSIADVSDPSAPVEVGFLDAGWSASGVAVSGTYAYVPANGAFRVIDVSDPAAPVEVGSVEAWLAGSVAVSDGYAYGVESGYGYGVLRVIDVSVPSAPVVVGLLDMPGSRPTSVAVDGGYAYVAEVRFGSGGDSLRVIDVRTPSAPVEVGFVGLADTPSGGLDIAVSDGYAYVAWVSGEAPEGGLRVIDVSTPSVPVEVGFVDFPGRAAKQDVAASEGLVYVADGGDGVRVIDVSTPSAPAEVSFIDTPGNAIGVATSGGYGYVADVSGGLRVIDVSTPSAPVEVGFVETLGNTANVAVSGGYAYVVGSDSGLSLIDVSTPSAPAEVGFLHIPRWALGVAVEGGYAYVVAWGDVYSLESGLYVIDVSTPSAPVEVGYVGLPSLLSDVAVEGGYAYVAWENWNEEGGLRVIDVRTPSAPVEVGFVNTPREAKGVAVAGGYAYVADYDWGLRVIDISTPSAPVEVGSLDTWGSGEGIAVSGGYAYVVGRVSWQSVLNVVDVSTPSAPVPVGFAYINYSGPVQVAVSDGYAYVASWEDGALSVIDVSVPRAPVQVGSVTLPEAGVVEAAGGYALLAAGDAGLYVFRECDPLGDPHKSFIPAAAVASGAQGAFFSTDVEINNTGAEEAQVSFQWLPRGEDNSEPLQSEPIAIAPGQSLHWENVLTELFNLEPDSLGALKMVASTSSVIGMSRTYNSPEGTAAGTLGQGLPAIRATEMIKRTEPRRILFLSEDDDFRANVGCVNGTDQPLRINIGFFNAEGEPLETKTMDLGPWSNNQINRIFEDYAPVNGYVDVWADSDDALYYCYGSMLDNLTSDPTTILPQVPSADTTFIPAAALAAGLEGSFFQTDIDLNNVGSTNITYEFLWLPRRDSNSDPIHSDTFSLAPGAGVRYVNVLGSVFGLEPDQVGALAVEASGTELLAMSRTYNLPSGHVAGTFGQELPGIPAEPMIPTGVQRRIMFLSENDDVRANVGCQNGSDQNVRVFIELLNSEGESLETRTMDLAPWSNNQITRVFRDHAPISAGYADVWTNAPGATIYCYGSVLDNLTSDPTTVLPQ